jgi:hypothetical protein
MRRDNDHLVQELSLMHRRLEDSRRNGSGSEKAELLNQQAGMFVKDSAIY